MICFSCWRVVAGYLEFRKSKRQEKFGWCLVHELVRKLTMWPVPCACIIARTQAKGGLCPALPPQMAPLLLAGSQQRLKALHLISSLSSNRISQLATQHS